jgi:Trk K+ transport system NAD-binding subunit
MKPKIIVCGLGRTGYKIFSLLRQQGARVVGINVRPIAGGDLEGIVIGDLKSAETLLAAGVQEANTLVLTSNDDALNLAVLTQARVLNPRIRIINRLFNSSLGDRLDSVLPDHFSMSVASLSAPVFMFAALGNRAIGQLQLFKQTWPIHEEYLDEDHPWLGRSLSDLWDDRGRMLIYYLPANSNMDLVSAVVRGQCLQVGDRLIIATQPKFQNARRSLKKQFTIWLTRLRQLHQHIQPAIAVLFALLLIILIATLTYVVIDQKVSIVDSLYFSVGMITGAGGNEGVAEQAPTSIKIFTVVMMLVGAGVVGICYALLNDLILGTRIKQLWHTTQVPQRQHFIVCGLGGIGIKIVQHLHHQGCEVVVIEADPNNRFLSAVHRLKIPVVQGDASIPDVLNSAHIYHASALLCVTSSDVANLEIALTAKGIAPKLPVIVRSQDAQFAPLAQQVFEFEAVLSPVELAAPSFAAAALGGRILGNGMTANSLWVALATIITSGHPFYGRRVRDAAMDADFVPLYLETNRQTIHGWDLLDFTLNVGDVLYLTMPANCLEQLWRITPAAQVGAWCQTPTSNTAY